MLVLYTSLLHLYPTLYRRQFGDEMITVFREASADVQHKGIVVTAKFYFREIGGLCRGAIAEHAWRVVDNYMSFPPLSRRFTMRSGFRFPKTTAFLMTVILAGVVLTIEKAESIRASVPYTNPPVGPIHQAHPTFLPTMVLMFLAVYVAGAIGWVILFGLRRSGVHRFSAILSGTPQK